MPHLPSSQSFSSSFLETSQPFSSTPGLGTQPGRLPFDASSLRTPSVNAPVISQDNRPPFDLVIPGPSSRPDYSPDFHRATQYGSDPSSPAEGDDLFHFPEASDQESSINKKEYRRMMEYIAEFFSSIEGEFIVSGKLRHCMEVSMKHRKKLLHLFQH